MTIHSRPKRSSGQKVKIVRSQDSMIWGPGATVHGQGVPIDEWLLPHECEPCLREWSCFIRLKGAKMWQHLTLFLVKIQCITTDVQEE